jgi:hypothetical protein
VVDIGLRDGITRKIKVRISSVCDPRWVEELSVGLHSNRSKFLC